MADTYTIHYPDYFDELYEMECIGKGIFQDVEVRFPDGRSRRLYLIQIERLRQDLEAEIQLGRNHVAEKDMIVVGKLGKREVEEVVFRLIQDGYFRD